MEKKITISESFYRKLINDIETFDFKTSNNEYKLNEFYNTIIINTYRYRNENQNQIIEKIKKILLNKDLYLSNNLIVKSIKENENKFNFNQNLIDLAIHLSNHISNVELIDSSKKYIFIRGTKHTNTILEEIANSALDTPVATIFRNILYEYMSYPLYIRERILFYDLYLKIINLKKNNLTCLIESKKTYTNFQTKEKYNNSFEFKIYDLQVGKEEYHNYLIGLSKNTNQKYNENIMSMKLSAIKSIITLKHTYSFSTQEQIIINERLAKGPEWVNGDEKEIVIEFSEYGLELFKKLYKDRPTPSLINNNIYTFIYSEKTLLNYLKQFGRHAKVLSPSSLKDKLKDFYFKAYNAYID